MTFMETGKRTYESLADIMARKAELKADLTANEKSISTLWGTLFKPEKQTAKTPSMKLANFISTGAGLLDGLLLGWKLYRRFLK